MTSHFSTESLLRLSDEMPESPRRAAAERHLTACTECQARREEIDAALGLYFDSRTVLAPAPADWPDLTGRMLEIAARVAERRSRRRLWWRWTIAGVAAAALAGVYYRQMPSARIQPQSTVALPFKKAPVSAPIPAAAPVPTPATLPSAVTPPIPIAVRQLQVLMVLHGIRADLGEVEILNDGGNIEVQSSGIDLSRRRQIQQVLTPIAGVKLTFDAAPDTAASLPRAGASGRESSAAEAPLRALLASRVTSGVPTDGAVDRILDAGDAALAQALALHSLARRYPREVEDTLPETGRAQLAGLRDDYVSEYARRLRDLRQLLAPVSRVERPEADESGDWRAHADRVFSAAKALDSALTVGFAARGRTTVSADEALGQLQDGLRRAWSAAGDPK